MARLVTATESATVSQLNQVGDLATSPSYKWFSLQDNKLDGSFHPTGAGVSARFSGITSQIDMGNKAAFALTTQITMECSVRAHSLSTANAQIFAKELDYKLILLSTGYVSALINTSDGWGNSIISNTLLPLRKWVDLTLTYNSATGSFVLYQDRVAVGSLTKTGALLATTTNPLILGGFVNGVNANRFIGDIREARLWNVAKTAAQVQSNGLTPLNGNEAGLVGYWKLNHLSGTSATDSTANANHGVATAVQWNLDAQMGWWGTSLSDVNGVIATNPAVTITDDPATIQDLLVAGDDLLNEYPVDFNVQLYDAANTLLKTVNIVGNTAVSRVVTVSPAVSAVTKIVITVLKVNKANRTAKLLDVMNLITIARSDSLNVKLAEVSTEEVSFTRIDTVTPKLAEVATETVSFTRTDLLAPKLAETVSETISISRTDILTPNLAETTQVSWIIYSTDVLAPTLGEVASETISFTRTDILRPKLAETALETVSIATVDTLAPTLTEAVTPWLVFDRVDSLAVKLYEEPNTRNLLNYGTWSPGSTGSQPGFPANGSAAENRIIHGTDPWGNPVPVWEMGSDIGNDADGGWNTGNFPIDHTKTYRFSVWVRRTVVGNGSVYLGVGGSTVANLSDGLTNGNPYFYSAGIGTTEWMLIVGHVFPSTHTGTALHPNSGLYRTTGKFANISADYKWLSTATQTHHRAYLYYSTDLNTRQEFCYPKVEVVDGNEPSIHHLYLNPEISNVTVLPPQREDILTPKLAETATQMWVYESSDILAPKLAEAATETVSFTALDTALVTTSDAVTDLYQLVQNIDVLTPTLNELATEDISFTRTDTLLPKLTEAATEEVSFTRTDIVLPKLSEAATEDISFTALDILASTITEQSNETVSTTRADSLIVTLGESSSQTISFTRTDILTPLLGEQSNVTATIVTLDTITPNVTEASNVSVAITVLDQLTPILSDISSFTQYEIWRNDSITPTLLETASEEVSISRTDVVTPTVSEAVSPTISFTRTDLLKPNISESLGEVIANLERADTLAPKLAEATSETISFTTNDTLAPKLAETKAITVSFTRTDIITPKASETRAITVSFTRTDFILVGSLVEAEDFIASLHRPDTLYVSLSEGKVLTNIHSVVDADYRQIFGRVQITYTDLFLDESVTAIASGSGRYTLPEDTANGIESVGRKLFSLHENVLDGSYFPLATGIEADNGWWSNVLSDASGAFTPGTEPTLTIAFDSRPIFYLQVIGDDQTNNYPVDFKIRLLDSLDALVHETVVVGNTLMKWRQDLTVPYTNVAKMQLVINKINKSNSASKIMEFYTIIKEIYEGDEIVSLNLLEEQVFEDRSLPIGNVSANEIDIVLDNSTGRFDPANRSSTLYGTLKKNRRVQAWLGAEIIPGTIEWHSLGVFWTLDWSAPRYTTEASFSARDRLELMRRSDFKGTEVLINVSLYDLAELVLRDYGLTSSEFIIDTNLQSTILPYAWFTRTTHRAALADIAIASLGRVYCNREGKVVVEAYEPMEYRVYEFTDDTSIIKVDHPLRWSQIVNYVEVTSSPLEMKPEESIFTGGQDPIVLPPNSSVVEVLVFNTSPATQILAPTFTADPSVSITNVDYYSWGLEVTFQNASAASQSVSSLVVRGRPLEVTGSRVLIAKDDVNIRDNGKQPNDMKHRFIQSAVAAQQIADSLLATYKDPRFDAEVKSRGNPALRLGDRVTLPDYGETTQDYQIYRQKITWDGGLEATVSAQKIGGN